MEHTQHLIAKPVDTIISVKNVSKVYRLFDKPVDRLKHTLFWRFGKNYGRDFWALNNITFDVQKGEALGIMGRNGSGKSTLLQILAGVLSPSVGQVEVKGRVSALLELGSGFNPEYTGRENVYMSGAIWGISKEEMDSRFDDIVSFADIGDFLDQPVKVYSSGMFARLAFSVAVAVEPDILIVDEILAVGDYAFQQKCVARMRQMRDRGLTLLYVSHSPNSIKDVCNKGLFLNEGRALFWGSSEEATNYYFKYIRELANQDALRAQPKITEISQAETNQVTVGKLRYGSGHAQIVDVQIYNDAYEPTRAFELGEFINLEARFHANQSLSQLNVSFLVRDNSGIDLVGTTTFDEHFQLPDLKAGEQLLVKFRFQNSLKAGNYGISIAITHVTRRDYSDNIVFDQIDAVATFLSINNPNRPIHYKFICPIEIDCKIGSETRGLHV